MNDGLCTNEVKTECRKVYLSPDMSFRCVQTESGFANTVTMPEPTGLGPQVDTFNEWTGWEE